jgi:hypothetical protein
VAKSYQHGRPAAASRVPMRPGSPDISRWPWQQVPPVIIVIITRTAGAWTPELLVSGLCALTALLAVSRPGERLA